jgi:hypothetical protein
MRGNFAQIGRAKMRHLATAIPNTFSIILRALKSKQGLEIIKNHQHTDLNDS